MSSSAPRKSFPHKEAARWLCGPLPACGTNYRALLLPQLPPGVMDIQYTERENQSENRQKRKPKRATNSGVRAEQMRKLSEKDEELVHLLI